VDNAELKTIFEAFGTVADAIVMVDQVTQRSRCFGFVTFGGEDRPAAAQRSIAAQPLSVYGRHVEVKFATLRAEQTGNANFKRGPPPGPKSVWQDRKNQETIVSSECKEKNGRG
jgi:RNA recognition motif-containing protein